MDAFTVQLEVADPQGRQYEAVEVMVDSGATYTVLPASLLERLGVVLRTAPAGSSWPTAAASSEALAEPDAARPPRGDLACCIPG